VSWLYGQTWLWYLIAFLVGLLLAWLVFVRPAQRRLVSLLSGSADAEAGGTGARSAGGAAAAGNRRTVGGRRRSGRGGGRRGGRGGRRGADEVDDRRNCGNAHRSARLGRPTETVDLPGAGAASSLGEATDSTRITTPPADEDTERVARPSGLDERTETLAPGAPDEQTETIGHGGGHVGHVAATSSTRRPTPAGHRPGRGRAHRVDPVVAAVDRRRTSSPGRPGLSTLDTANRTAAEAETPPEGLPVVPPQAAAPPTPDEPTADKPTADQPIPDEPVRDHPTASGEPTADEPNRDEPTVDHRSPTRRSATCPPPIG
jgi:hypothetical protein